MLTLEDPDDINSNVADDIEYSGIGGTLTVRSATGQAGLYKRSMVDEAPEPEMIETDTSNLPWYQQHPTEHVCELNHVDCSHLCRYDIGMDSCVETEFCEFAWHICSQFI